MLGYYSIIYFNFVRGVGDDVLLLIYLAEAD